MGKRLTNMMKDFGTDYESLYRMYFDRTANIQTNFTRLPYMNTQASATEVTELKRKLTELERKLDRKRG
jgi:hypothetical protein